MAKMQYTQATYLAKQQNKTKPNPPQPLHLSTLLPLDIKHSVHRLLHPQIHPAQHLQPLLHPLCILRPQPLLLPTQQIHRGTRERTLRQVHKHPVPLVAIPRRKAQHLPPHTHQAGDAAAPPHERAVLAAGQGGRGHGLVGV